MYSIYDFIKEKETEYQKPIQLEDGWDWSMKDHLRRSFLYKNSQFEEENENRNLRPNKNIVLAIRNVENRTEGFDVKDINLYVDDPDESYKSFLVKKYHDKWALENAIDTAIDESVDSYGDYGGTLVRDTSESRPEIIDLRTLAFCNQRNILTYPFCIKHNYSPSQLREMTEWGLDSNGATIDIESFLTLCKDEEEIFAYELHGTVPIEWLDKKRQSEESKKDLQQIQIVAYYKKEDGNEQGVTLFRKREPKLPFKFLKRDDIKDRALGRGGVEELVEPQKWTNWNEIKITEMLEAASKMIGVHNDPTLAAKHPTGMKDMDNMEFIELQEGKELRILDTYPRNLAVFNDSLERWQVHAQQLGSASEQLLGGDLNSGVPFKLYEAKNIDDKSMHRFRQGKIAVFWDEIYRDWIIPHISSEIANDHTFLAELSADEMQKVVEQVAINESNRIIVEKVLNGEDVTPEEQTSLMEKSKQGFLKDNKKFIKILKKEITKPLSVMTNIAGKQKNLALLTDKIVGVLRQYLATPQIRQDPEMNKLLNVILESSGLSPIMFGASPMPPQAPQGAPQAPQAPQGQQGLQMPQANAIV
jgi:hypothetical protein